MIQLQFVLQQVLDHAHKNVHRYIIILCAYSHCLMISYDLPQKVATIVMHNILE